MALRDTGKASMAYFYFDFRDVDKQKLHNLLPSLLIQLSARQISVAISSPGCILYTTVEYKNPAIVP